MGWPEQKQRDHAALNYDTTQLERQHAAARREKTPYGQDTDTPDSLRHKFGNAVIYGLMFMGGIYWLNKSDCENAASRNQTANIQGKETSQKTPKKTEPAKRAKQPRSAR